MMMKHLFFSFLLLSLTACAKKIPKSIRKNFTNCYTGKPVNIRSLINIDGYYMFVRLERWSSGYGPTMTSGDSSEINMLFYEDGTFLYNFFKDNDYPNNTKQYLSDITKNKNFTSFYTEFDWGIYRIAGDTLIVQYINNVSKAYFAPWNCWEKRFKIIDRNTLQYVGASNLADGSAQALRIFKEAEAKRKYLPAKFIPCEVIPPPNSWLKKEDWVWCQ